MLMMNLTHRILVGAVIETIVSGIIASLTDDALPKIAGDYRYDNDERDDADTHFNRARNPSLRCRMYVLPRRKVRVSVAYDMRGCVSRGSKLLRDDIRRSPRAIKDTRTVRWNRSISIDLRSESTQRGRLREVPILRLETGSSDRH